MLRPIRFRSSPTGFVSVELDNDRHEELKLNAWTLESWAVLLLLNIAAIEYSGSAGRTCMFLARTMQLKQQPTRIQSYLLGTNKCFLTAHLLHAV